MNFIVVFVQIFFELLSFVVIARIFLSWFRFGAAPGPISRFIIETSQPILSMARRITPRTGMLDFSPIVAMVGLDIVKRIILFFLTGI
ncbi:YggT family protein [Candidatus Peregrinibacteria bacterium]|nr:YggT family protein [Candidatus Peregrinibacteria bacterium]